MYLSINRVEERPGVLEGLASMENHLEGVVQGLLVHLVFTRSKKILFQCINIKFDYFEVLNNLLNVEL